MRLERSDGDSAGSRASRDAQCCARDVSIVSADWAGAPRRRAVYVARRARARPADRELRRSAPPAGDWSLAALLDLAVRLRDRDERPVLVGIDAVLGMPRAFLRASGRASFLDALLWLDAGGGLERECADPSRWRPERPFFRVPRGPGGLTRVLQAAGGRGTLLREIERRAGAKPAFALSGIPGTVGSGTRALWRELAPRIRDPERGFRLWPFEGGLRTLTSRAQIVVAEVYPRASYTLARAETLPAQPRRVAKTRADARARELEALARTRWLAASRLELFDVDPARASEDDFDALVTALGLARLVSEARPLAGELVDPIVEGGLLGTGEVTLPVRREVGA